MKRDDYALVDSGNGRKLERFGVYLLSRPCSQARWTPQLSAQQWDQADAIFSREQQNQWTYQPILPDTWLIEVGGLQMKISPTDFGHLGVFPEQIPHWQWIQMHLKRGPIAPKPRLLNLFAYSGGATLAAAKAGASVCHLDASKGMVAWAREQAGLNGLEQAPIRWVVEDVKKFLIREKRRGSLYEAIVLDPPTFGRGAQGEVFKIEEDIVPLLRDCRALLSSHPLFMLFSCHTPGFTPLVMHHLMTQAMQGLQGRLEVGEMVLSGESQVLHVPSGTYAKWWSHEKGCEK